MLFCLNGLKKCLDADFYIEYVLKSSLKNVFRKKNDSFCDSSVILNDDIWGTFG